MYDSRIIGKRLLQITTKHKGNKNGVHSFNAYRSHFLSLRWILKAWKITRNSSIQFSIEIALHISLAEGITVEVGVHYSLSLNDFFWRSAVHIETRQKVHLRCEILDPYIPIAEIHCAYHFGYDRLACFP